MGTRLTEYIFKKLIPATLHEAGVGAGGQGVGGCLCLMTNILILDIWTDGNKTDRI